MISLSLLGYSIVPVPILALHIGLFDVVLNRLAGQAERVWGVEGVLEMLVVARRVGVVVEWIGGREVGGGVRPGRVNVFRARRRMKVERVVRMHHIACGTRCHDRRWRKRVRIAAWREESVVQH